MERHLTETILRGSLVHVTAVPIFPLGTVLLPSMPTALSIFEDRYVVMMARVLQKSGEFGIVLIERGSEVGGGDQRFRTGTMAQITKYTFEDGILHLTAVGSRRFEVDHWLLEDPHPQARVRLLPDLDWSDDLHPLKDEAEALVRKTLAEASKYGAPQWPADLALSAEPTQAAWQLAGISPIGPLDQLRLLRATTMHELLRLIIELTAATAEILPLGWPEAFGGFADGPDLPRG